VVLDAAVGQGRAILFGLNVQNRAQSYSSMKLMWNAVFYRAAAPVPIPAARP
jgi:hypothetical protein